MKQTVFVLGAGSSAVFSFPIGQQLCEAVCEQLAINGTLRGELCDCTDFREDQMESFSEQLRLSAQFSVDAFLEHRPEFLELGKAAMALILVRHEYKTPGTSWSDTLWRGQDANWMRYLFGRLNAPFERFPEIPVSFITFNYDRAMEHFLVTTLQNRYGKTEAECAVVLERIPIVHLHGRLGYLPWQKGEGRRPYNAEMNREVMKICVKSSAASRNLPDYYKQRRVSAVA
jgi:hypothetical protein